MRSKEGDSAGQHSERLLPEQHVDAAAADPAARSPRLVSLDIVRGFTVATMVFVDNIGSTFNTLNHSPWNGITLADIVMPWFLFMVGVAMSISLRKFVEGGGGRAAQRRAGFQKLLVRSLKLFFLGLAMQGGGFPSHGHFGYNLRTIRWNGILQRISFAYFAVGTIKLFVPEWRPHQGGAADAPASDGGHLMLVARYAYQWAAVSTIALIYVLLMTTTSVPDWTVATIPSTVEHGSAGKTIQCGGVRGDLGPKCNAANFWDRTLFGQAHLYNPGTKARLPSCSKCSPGACWDKSKDGEMPPFCYAPEDPEGATASILTPLSTYIGLHFGHAIRHTRERTAEPQQALMRIWGASAVLCLVLGGLLVPAFPLCKNLWSPSYVFVQAGMCGGTLLAVFALCDVWKVARVSALLRPFQYMGMNALFVFVMGASSVFENLFGGVYVDDPKNNIFAWCEKHLFDSWIPGTNLWSNQAGAKLVFVFCKVSFWLVVSWVLHRRKWYWKF